MFVSQSKYDYGWLRQGGGWDSSGGGGGGMLTYYGPPHSIWYTISMLAVLGLMSLLVGSCG